MYRRGEVRSAGAVWVLGLLLAIAVSLVPKTTLAQPTAGPVGLGIILGDPSGITVKFWFDDLNGVQIHGAWDLSDERFVIMADYLFHFTPFTVNTNKFVLPLYVGVGGKIGIGDNISLGVRIPVGIDMVFTNAPVDVFLELVPGLRLIDSTGFDFDAGIGARYWF